MANFTVKFSAMGGTKTRELLAIAYNFEVDCGLKILTIKPSLDKRDGYDVIKSRDGGERKADLVVTDDVNIFEFVNLYRPSIVLSEESQFLQKHHVKQLRKVVDELDIPVIAFGLKNDFSNEMFEGMKYLFLYGDEFQQIKTLCRECHSRSATMNMRLFNGIPVFEGEQVQLGGNESYKAVCSRCYNNLKNNGKSS